MACGEFFRVDIKQSVSWVVLWCICWMCIADFSSRHVIFMVPFFLTSMSSTRQHTCSCAALCEISRCYLSFLPTSTLDIILGVLCTFSDNLGGTGLHSHKCPIPLSIEGNHDRVFRLCSFDYNFSTTKFKFGYGLYCPIMCFLDFLTSIGVGHKSVTQRPFRNWMSSLSALTSRTG